MTNNMNMIDNELENISGGASNGAQYYKIVPGDTIRVR